MVIPDIKLSHNACLENNKFVWNSEANTLFLNFTVCGDRLTYARFTDKVWLWKYYRERCINDSFLCVWK